jgi:DNA polymerase elongation subunit (family B)
MLKDISINQILFLDIETVPEVYSFTDLDENRQKLWSDKTKYFQTRDGLDAGQVYEKAGIYAEFGKVICISTAFVYQKEGRPRLRIKSFSGDDEKEVLSAFSKVLDDHFSGLDKYLCGHNIKEFDIPYMARRMLLNGLHLPEMINLPGKKPWEVRHLDTLELWKFGDYKHFTSLNLLTNLFGIPTPKDDISGADVARVYWEDSDLVRITKYCEKDTIAVAHLMHRFKNLPLIPEEDLEYV